MQRALLTIQQEMIDDLLAHDVDKALHRDLVVALEHIVEVLGRLLRVGFVPGAAAATHDRVAAHQLGQTDDLVAIVVSIIIALLLLGTSLAATTSTKVVGEEVEDELVDNQNGGGDV